VFEPPLALASLSGEADAEWALAAADHAGAAFLGGIALDAPTRKAARQLVARDRKEFLPADPLAFIDDQLQAVATDTASIRPAVNVRTTTADPIRAAAAICADYCDLRDQCSLSTSRTLCGRLWRVPVGR